MKLRYKLLRVRRFFRSLPPPRQILSRPRTLLPLALLAAVLITALSVAVPKAVNAVSVKKELPIYSVGRDDKVVSISFDAAWGADDTQTLIDILDRYNVKATFFVVGDWVEKYPQQVKALHGAGHEVMNHSDTHAHMPKLTAEQIAADLNACNDKIEAITGVRPTLFRPPYGDYNNTLINTVREMGMYTIQWDVDSLDWKDLSASEIINRVTSKVGPGSIVLFHNDAKNTPAALPAILESLINDGYTIVPISKIIYTDNYSIDHTGRQMPVTKYPQSFSAVN